MGGSRRAHAELTVNAGELQKASVATQRKLCWGTIVPVLAMVVLTWGLTQRQIMHTMHASDGSPDDRW